MLNTIDLYSMEAETKEDSFRKTVTEKKELLKSFENVLANSEKDLKLF